MAYNFNANQFYSKPNQGFQPRNVSYAPAFGHQVSASPYYPANAYGLPSAQALPLPRNVTPLAPLPPLPAPGQFLSPPNSSLPAGVNAPFRMNNTVGSGQFLPTPKPQIQQHFYTLPGVKEPASRKKSIKKFLLITSAVVTGVFATAASVMGLMWMFWPGFVELGRNIGPKGASRAAHAIKEWKKPGPLLQRVLNVYEACTRQSESSTQTGWQRIKNWLRPTSTKAAGGRAPEEATAEKKEAGNVLADMVNAFSAEEENIDALTVLLKKLGLDLEKLTSSQYLADVINKVDSEKVTSILKSLVTDILEKLKPQLEQLTSSEHLAEVINQVDSEIVTSILKSLVPDILEKLKPQLDKLTSSEHLADVINQVDSKKLTSILESLVPGILEKLKPQLDKLTSSENLAKVIIDVINQVEPKKVTAVLESSVPAALNAALPKDAAEILAAARETGSTSQLAEGFWNLLTEKQQTGIYKQLSLMVTQAMDEYVQSRSGPAGYLLNTLLGRKGKGQPAGHPLLPTEDGSFME